MSHKIGWTVGIMVIDREHHSLLNLSSPETARFPSGPFLLSAAGRWATMHGWLVDERGQRLRDLCRR